MIKLAIFDMDGTVFESHLDWEKIRRDLGIKSNILKEIYQDNGVDHKKLKKLEGYEEDNTLKTVPIRGISDFLTFLETRGITSVLVTNNNRKNTDFLLNRFDLSFDSVLTREKKMWKPSPEPFLFVMERYRCKQEESISIGDSHYDVLASREAGIKNIFIIKNKRQLKLSDTGNIVFFSDFLELKYVLNEAFSIDSSSE
ncbi:MAG: HAD family hydrolase [Candidatus Aminicenantes bacterium]|nr:HAD family hydrolase [Candidatus Aminicenantes bacterium]